MSRVEQASVVIPLYNKVKYIQRALDSVLAQTFEDFEVIVVNDGSTDGSEKVVEQYANARVRLVHQKNAGECAARNRGIDEARTDLVAFLDADDEWLPGFLDSILRLRGRFPDCGAYAAAYDFVEADGRRCPAAFNGIPAPPWEGILPNYFRAALGCSPVCSSAVAVPKRVFDSVGLFPLGVRRGGDTDMWCRVALGYPLAFTTKVGAVCHQDAEDRVSIRAPAPKLCEYQPARTVAGALAAGKTPPGVTRTDIAEYLNVRLLWFASDCVVAGRNSDAREHLRRAASIRSKRGVWLRLWVRAHLPTPLQAAATRAWRLSKSPVNRKSGSDRKLDS